MATTGPNFFLILHVQSAELHLRELATCADEMERMLYRERDRLKKRVDRKAAKIDDEELRSIYYEETSEEWDQLTLTFPELVRSAFFSKSVSAFETYLLRAAQAHQRRARIAVGLGDLRGDGIAKAKLYFTKVAGLPFPSGSAHWSDLCRLSEIRNIVVHCDSVPPEEKAKQIRQFVTTRFPEITFDPKGRLQFSEAACGKLIDICEAFLKEFRKLLR